MKKIILVILIFSTLSCTKDSADDIIVGKWIIYKAVYGETVYQYEINGQCGQESLEFLPKKSYSNSVMNTFYSNSDCTGFSSNRLGTWVKADDGVYNIYDTSTVPYWTLSLSSNEIKVTELISSTSLIKYYKKAM
jgi:hypothetical protein